MTEEKGYQAPGNALPGLIDRVTEELAQLQTMIDLMIAELKDEESGTDSGAAQRLKEIHERMQAEKSAPVP